MSIAPNIHIQDVSLSYKNQLIFSELNLYLPAGQWIALLGPSGIGKTSLLRLIAGLNTHNEYKQGKIITDNHIDINEQVAYMAQTDLLLPWMSVLDNAILGIKLKNHSSDEYRHHLNQAKSLLHQVGLGETFHLYPQELSGGMRQRVALVRTIIENKPIILMDEPFSALDAITRYKLQTLAVEYLKNKTVLFITHDPWEALRLAHEIYIMQGQPAKIKLITQLSTKTPREMTDTQIIALQAELFSKLAHGSEMS